MLKRILFLGILVTFVTTVIVLWTDGLGNTLFREARWLFIGAVIIGTAAGIVGAGIKHASLSRNVNIKTERHTVDSTMEHWGTAIGIFILIISGFQIRFQSGFAGTNLHFLGLFLTLLFGTYFVSDFFASKKTETLLPDMRDIIDGTLKKYFLHTKSKETGKYLASQKSSFLLFAIVGGQILISGVIKLLVFYVHIPVTLVQVATLVHDISAFLFVLILIIHVFLVLTKRENRILLRSWFTGKTNGEPHPEPDTAVNFMPQEVETPVGIPAVNKDILVSPQPEDVKENTSENQVETAVNPALVERVGIEDISPENKTEEVADTASVQRAESSPVLPSVPEKTINSVKPEKDDKENPEETPLPPGLEI